MARGDTLKQIAKDISYEENVYPHVAEEIIKSQFKLVADVMIEGSTRPVRLRHLGVFVAKKRFREFSTLKEYFSIYGTNKKKFGK